MSSLILRTAARYLIPLLVVFSIFTLLRGHNLPGGGFAGGLLASIALSLYIFAWDADTARRALHFDPHHLLGGGLLLALASGIPNMLRDRAFLTGWWPEAQPGKALGLSIGTPVLFDIGVYLVVIGTVMMIVLELTDEEERH